MASINYVKNKLEEAGLKVETEGDFILCEDPGLFERSHDGVKGISRWLKETLSEYEEACAELFAQDEEYTQEEPINIVEKRIQEGLLAAAPPIKEHAGPEAQMEMAQEFNSPKEIYQAAQIDDQDAGGVANPEAYIRDMKMEAPAITILVKGQRFVAPEGWKIKESRLSGKVLYYGSVYQARKVKNEARGATFSLVRESL